MLANTSIVCQPAVVALVDLGAFADKRFGVERVHVMITDPRDGASPLEAAAPIAIEERSGTCSPAPLGSFSPSIFRSVRSGAIGSSELVARDRQRARGLTS